MKRGSPATSTGGCRRIVRPRCSSGAMSVSTTAQPVSSAPAGALAAPVAEDLPGIGCQEGVTRPALSALQRLEEKAVRAPMQLGEGGDGSIAVEDYLPGDRHHPAGAGPLGEDLEARSSLRCRHDVAHLGRAASARRLSAAGRVEGSSST